MTYGKWRISLLAGAALGLVACGGGGGGDHLNSTPPPPPSPTPPPPPPPTGSAIIQKATTSQEFAVKGAIGTSLAPNDQIRVRYDAATNGYDVQLPSSGTWERLSSFNPNSYQSASLPQLNVQKGLAPGYEYSALAELLLGGDEVGAAAFGIPTPAGGVPTTGSATFNGSIFGQSTETYFNGLYMQTVPSNITGNIDLGFNFGAGTLSGSISPILNQGGIMNNLPSLQFTNAVYSAGSTSFSGTFGTSLSGSNSFSGLFTGPLAQELIGNFAFPYKSPLNSNNYQATGAFVAKKN